MFELSVFTIEHFFILLISILISIYIFKRVSYINQLKSQVQGLIERQTIYTNELTNERNKNEVLLTELKDEIRKNENLKEEVSKLNTQIDALSLSSNVLSDANDSIFILGIWPEVATLTPIRQMSEIDAILENGFKYIKLHGERVSKAIIVNELTLEPEINIVHIGAHGFEEGIALSHEGVLELAEPNWFGKILSKREIKVVLLFSCLSQNTIDTIYRMGIPCVLGFRQEVNDKNVIEFIKEFYKYLQLYKNVKKAVEYATLSSSITDQHFYNDMILRGNYIFT